VSVNEGMILRAAALLLSCLALTASNAAGDWCADGNAILGAGPGSACSDGSGGVIAAWGNGNGIYAQRLDSSGVRSWLIGGVRLASTGQVTSISIVSDGNGGAIIAWSALTSPEPYGPSDLYAQRVTSSGEAMWGTNGVVVCDAARKQDRPSIVSDRAQGAVIVWEDERDGGGFWDIYAQRLNDNGTPQWQPNGVGLCTLSRQQGSPVAVSDGASGAIAVWGDMRNDTPAHPRIDIYAQRVDALGQPKWTADGVEVLVSLMSEGPSAAVSDGAGGVIVGWSDRRRELYFEDVYSQRLNADGIAQWTQNGVAICTAPDHQYPPYMASDGAGGAILVWQDARDAWSHIYAQRIDISGAVLWQADGVPVCTAARDQGFPQVAADGLGGAFVCWRDNRDITQFVYAQRLDAMGTPQWTVDGIRPFSARPTTLESLVQDDTTPIVLCDAESTEYLRAQRMPLQVVMCADTLAPSVPTSFTVAYNTGGGNTLSWDESPNVDFFHFNVYRSSSPDFESSAETLVHSTFTNSWVDLDHRGGFYYKVTAMDLSGKESAPVSPSIITGLGRPPLPTTLALYPNVPNPFNPSTMIRFALPTSVHVELAIYDTNGRLVRTLVNEVRGYGEHEVTWNGRNEAGAGVSSGVYFYRLRAGKFNASQKMVLLK
jgi:FlgD Ig-like domain